MNVRNKARRCRAGRTARSLCLGLTFWVAQQPPVNGVEGVNFAGKRRLPPLLQKRLIDAMGSDAPSLPMVDVPSVDLPSVALPPSPPASKESVIGTLRAEASEKGLGSGSQGPDEEMREKQEVAAAVVRAVAEAALEAELEESGLSRPGQAQALKQEERAQGLERIAKEALTELAKDLPIIARNVIPIEEEAPLPGPTKPSNDFTASSTIGEPIIGEAAFKGKIGTGGGENGDVRRGGEVLEDEGDGEGGEAWERHDRLLRKLVRHGLNQTIDIDDGPVRLSAELRAQAAAAKSIERSRAEDGDGGGEYAGLSDAEQRDFLESYLENLNWNALVGTIHFGDTKPTQSGTLNKAAEWNPGSRCATVPVPLRTLRTFKLENRRRQKLESKSGPLVSIRENGLATLCQNDWPKWQADHRGNDIGPTEVEQEAEALMDAYRIGALEIDALKQALATYGFSAFPRKPPQTPPGEQQAFQEAAASKPGTGAPRFMQVGSGTSEDGANILGEGASDSEKIQSDDGQPADDEGKNEPKGNNPKWKERPQGSLEQLRDKLKEAAEDVFEFNFEIGSQEDIRPFVAAVVEKYVARKWLASDEVCRRNYTEPCPSAWDLSSTSAQVLCKAPELYDGLCDRELDLTSFSDRGSRTTRLALSKLGETCFVQWPCRTGPKRQTLNRCPQGWTSITPENFLKPNARKYLCLAPDTDRLCSPILYFPYFPLPSSRSKEEGGQGEEGEGGEAEGQKIKEDREKKLRWAEECQEEWPTDPEEEKAFNAQQDLDAARKVNDVATIAGETKKSPFVQPVRHPVPKDISGPLDSHTGRIHEPISPSSLASNPSANTVFATAFLNS